jgi:hypothetical protein
MLNFNDQMLTEAHTWFQLIQRGKLEFTSNDEKKNIGQDPIPLDRFLKENSKHFFGGRQ